MYKTEQFEHYLDTQPTFYAQSLINLRMSNNHLPIRTLRWKNSEHRERSCHMCNSSDIGDEFHYIFKCTHFNDLQKQLIPTKYTINANCLSYNLYTHERE